MNTFELITITRSTSTENARWNAKGAAQGNCTESKLQCTCLISEQLKLIFVREENQSTRKKTSESDWDKTETQPTYEPRGQGQALDAGYRGRRHDWFLNSPLWWLWLLLNCPQKLHVAETKVICNFCPRYSNYSVEVLNTSSMHNTLFVVKVDAFLQCLWLTTCML